MRHLFCLILLIFLVSLSCAETTFFDQDDLFTMGSSPATTSEGITGTAINSEIIGRVGCTYKWNCTDWSECLSFGKQIRSCTNVGTCLSTYRAPETERNCTLLTSPEIEEEEEMGEEEVVNKKRVAFYIIIAFVIGFVIFYLGKNYFKRVIISCLRLKNRPHYKFH